jgi:DNA-3-methyladenine glycosylase II
VSRSAGAQGRKGALDRELARALSSLKRSDATLAGLIDSHGERVWQERIVDRPREPFAALLRAIVGQQVSVAAARTIFARVEAIFGNRVPSAQELLAADPMALRQAGLSRSKARYARELAARASQGVLDPAVLECRSDEEVVALLEAVPGIGRWTAQMFLIFHLGRLDVLPSGDLGLRRAVGVHYGFAETPPPAIVAELGERWRPYRSLATVYLWRSIAAAT